MTRNNLALMKLTQLLEVDVQSPQTLEVEVQSWAAQLEEVHSLLSCHFNC